MDNEPAGDVILSHGDPASNNSVAISSKRSASSTTIPLGVLRMITESIIAPPRKETLILDTQKLFTRVEIKAVDGEQRLITGYAAAVGNLDRTKDIIDKGAFDRTLKENTDVVAFIGHDSSKLPVGEPVSIQADDHGLLTVTSVYNTPDGDALLEVARRRLARGKTLGMSIGYRSVKERYQGNTRHLLDVDLVEYSFLASPDFAANPLATVTGMKAHKATGTGPVITTEDSYEDLIDDLEDAASRALSVGYVCVCATFSDHVIVSTYSMNDDGSVFYDFPYTLNADGEPELGEPTEVDPAFVPADAKARGRKASSGYDVDDNDTGASGRSDFAYVDSDGRGHLPIHDAAHVRAAFSRFDQTEFDSDAKKAQAARKILARAKELDIDVDPDSAVAKAAGGKGRGRVFQKGPDMTRAPWDAAFVATLPDNAFAVIEGDGTATKDDTGRTVPRGLRHYPHHNQDGSVDAAHLAHALEHAAQSGDGFGGKALQHLAGHAFAATHAIDAHAPEWSEGAAATLLLVAFKFDQMITDLAEDRRSMERLGIDTKKGARLNSSMRARLKDAHLSIGQILEWADAIEKGDDGKMRVDMFRHRLAMLQLEEVS